MIRKGILVNSRDVTQPSRLVIGWVGLLSIVVTLVGSFTAQATLLSTGDDGHLWVAFQNGEGEVTLYHSYSSETAIEEKRSLIASREGDIEDSAHSADSSASSPFTFRRAAKFDAGRVIIDLVAQGSSVHLLMQDGGVRRIDAQYVPLGPSFVFDINIGPTLPDGAMPRKLALVNKTKFALVRIESAAALEALKAEVGETRFTDTPNSSQSILDIADPRMRIALGLPPEPEETPIANDESEQSKPVEQSDEVKVVESESSSESLVELNPLDVLAANGYPFEVLLMFQPGDRSWSFADLPDDWIPGGRFAWLGLPNVNSYPLIVAESLDVEDDSFLLDIYRYDAQNQAHWLSKSLEIFGGKPAWYNLTQSDGQFILGMAYRNDTIHDAMGARSSADDSDGSATGKQGGIVLSILRAGNRLPLAHLDQPEAGRGFALAHLRDHVMVVTPMLPGMTSVWVEGETNGPVGAPFVVSVVNLEGEVVAPPAQPIVGGETNQMYSPELGLLAVCMVLSMVLMLAYWPRDPRVLAADLPPSIRAAAFFKRMLAGSIDLSPGFLLVYLVYANELQTLEASHWPGQQLTGTWHSMLPSLIVIGVYLAWCLGFELTVGRTPGKMMMQLYVVTDQPPHQRPKWKAVVLRNITKVLDLIAWPLLLLPLFWPRRQRLGDLIGRTLVIEKRSDPTGKQSGDES